MCRNKFLPLLTITPVVLSGPIRVHMHLQRCIRRLSCTRQHASPVLHQVSTQPLEFLHVSTPLLFHVSRETLHRFSNVNPVLSDIRQLHHQAAVQSRLRWRESRNSRSVLFALHFSWHVANRRLFHSQLHALQSTLNKFRVSLQSHLIIQHINFDGSIEDLQLLRVTCWESNVTGLFHSNRFSRTFPKVCNWFWRANTQKSSPQHNPLRSPSRLQKKAGHAVPIFMEPSFNTSDHVSPQIDAASCVPYMLLQSLANLPFCSCPSERCV